MPELAERLSLSDDLRYSWLQTNDTFLLCELNKLFGKQLYVRGKPEGKNGASVKEFFEKYPEVDYLIYSNDAPTHRGLKYVEKSRIIFHRPGKRWGRSYFRPAALRYVRLKRQILTIFQEEIEQCVR